MAVVIRLQGLRITAGPEDIRRFFTGLKIPDGGVHVIGGKLEEAFIIFASDEDARRAMIRSGGLIQGSPVTLLLSSKTEMQNLLQRSTKNAELDQKRQFDENARRARRSLDHEDDRGRAGSSSGYTPPLEYKRASSSNTEISCLFLKGLPFSVTEKEIEDFFSGLLVDEVLLLKNTKGSNNGTGFARFATRVDAIEGLKRDRNYIGSRYIEVMRATAQDWHRAALKMSNVINDDNFIRERSPIRSQRSIHTQEQMKEYQTRPQSPVAKRRNVHSEEEYCVLLDNLSYAVEKNDIKNLFHDANLRDDQILHLIDKTGKRTRSAFVLFRSLSDFCKALTQEKKTFFSRLLHIRPISRENMITLLESKSALKPGNSEQFQEDPPLYKSNPKESEKICLFVRNLPFDVRKVEIVDFLHGFNVTENKVFLLRDHKGAGVGMALVLFSSEADATEVLCLNGRRFLGSEVSLKCITRSEMEQLGVEPPMEQDPSQEDLYSGRSSGPSYGFEETGYTDFRNPCDNNTLDSNDYGCSETFGVDTGASHSRGNGTSVPQFDGPTCVKLINLPFQISIEEIYDFCYGYRIIPGSVSLQFDESGISKGSATAVFQSWQEAQIAIRELSGRPIGPRKVQLVLV